MQCIQHKVSASDPSLMLLNSNSFFLYTKGHSAASDRHAHETELMLQAAEDEIDVQRIIADRAITPTVQAYSRLYNK